jgi:hypothetical protein
MTAASPDVRSAVPAVHPLVRRRRIADLLARVLGIGLAIGLSYEIATSIAQPNLPLTFGLMIGIGGLATLIGNPRLEVTVTILAVYLGCLDGPLKGFGGGGTLTAVARDVLIFAVVIGAVVRLLARPGPIRMPAMSGWMFAFISLVLVEALNPNTQGLLKIAGGYRQQLEWVPFFFFGYALINTRERMRKMFLILGAIALANGIVGAIQARLSPQQLASWGPGYAERIEGANGVSGTTFRSEGEGHVRPVALGSDIGFGGTVGVIALPGILALLAARYKRRKWVIPLLATGALLAVATSLSRTSVLGAICALVAFGVFSLSAGRQMLRPLAAMLVLMVIGVGVVTVLSSTEGESAFSRYASIAPEKVATTAPSYKELSLKQIPNDIANDPFGFGLGVSGAAASFGGRTTVKLEGHGFSAETQYNFVMNEVGLPGLIVWIALTFYLLWLAATRLRTVQDIEIRIGLSAIAAVISGLTIMGFAGAFMAGSGSGPYFWFAMGVMAYWLVGPGRFRAPEPDEDEDELPVPGPSSAPAPLNPVVAGAV